MGLHPYEGLSDFARELVAVAYNAQRPMVVGLRENHHPTRGFTMLTLTDMYERLFTVTVLPSGEILLRELGQGDSLV